MSRPVQHIHHHGSGLGYLLVFIGVIAVAGESAGRAVSPHHAARAAPAPSPTPAPTHTVIVHTVTTHYVSRSPVSGTDIVIMVVASLVVCLVLGLNHYRGSR